SHLENACVRCARSGTSYSPSRRSPLRPSRSLTVSSFSAASAIITLKIPRFLCLGRSPTPSTSRTSEPISIRPISPALRSCWFVLRECLTHERLPDALRLLDPGHVVSLAGPCASGPADVDWGGGPERSGRGHARARRG